MQYSVKTLLKIDIILVKIEFIEYHRDNEDK